MLGEFLPSSAGPTWLVLVAKPMGVLNDNWCPVFMYPWLSYSSWIMLWFLSAAPMETPMPMSLPPSPVTWTKVIS